MPGGFGTADELFEILDVAQLGIHGKPVGLLNVNGFFDPLLCGRLDGCVGEGFLRRQHRETSPWRERADELLDALQTARRHRHKTPKWADREDR